MNDFENTMISTMNKLIESMNTLQKKFNKLDEHTNAQSREIIKLKGLIEEQDKEIGALKTHVVEELSPTKLQAIGVRAVREGTFTVSDLETFVASMRENFNDVGEAFGFTNDLIRTETQKIRNSIPSGVHRGGIYS